MCVSARGSNTNNANEIYIYIKMLPNYILLSLLLLLYAWRMANVKLCKQRKCDREGEKGITATIECSVDNLF